MSFSLNQSNIDIWFLTLGSGEGGGGSFPDLVTLFKSNKKLKLNY